MSRLGNCASGKRRQARARLSLSFLALLSLSLPPLPLSSPLGVCSRAAWQEACVWPWPWPWRGPCWLLQPTAHQPPTQQHPTPPPHQHPTPPPHQHPTSPPWLPPPLWLPPPPGLAPPLIAPLRLPPPLCHVWTCTPTLPLATRNPVPCITPRVSSHLFSLFALFSQRLRRPSRGSARTAQRWGKWSAHRRLPARRCCRPSPPRSFLQKGFCKNSNASLTGTCVDFSGIKCDGCSAKDCYVWQCNSKFPQDLSPRPARPARQPRRLLPGLPSPFIRIAPESHPSHRSAPPQ